MRIPRPTHPNVATGLLFIHLLTATTPAAAQTTDLSAVSPIPLANQLIQTTTTALLITLALALLTTLTLTTLRRLRWISPNQELHLTRTLRILFGALILLSITLPYLTLNFPPTITTPIILATLLTLAITLWTQNQNPNNPQNPILD